jgi:hypothetical protein
VAPGDNDANWRNSFNGIMGDLQTGGEYLHRAGPPTGYSELSPAWSGVGGVLMRDNQAARLVSALPNAPAVLGVTPGASNAQIVDELAETILSGRISPEDRAALEQFLATLPGSPTHDQKVRAAAAVLLSSPGFLAH